MMRMMAMSMKRNWKSPRLLRICEYEDMNVHCRNHTMMYFTPQKTRSDRLMMIFMVLMMQRPVDRSCLLISHRLFSGM